MIGSHFDTVRDAGRYDGVLGVLCAIEVADAIGSAAGPLEVVAFADEEGTRYGVAYLGSTAYRGRFDAAWLELADEDGMTMAVAIERGGGDVAALVAQGAAHPIGGYLEVHIEQGPVLETEGLPVGVVTAIVGQTRGRCDSPAAPVTPARCRRRFAPTHLPAPPSSCLRSRSRCTQRMGWSRRSAG